MSNTALCLLSLSLTKTSARALRQRHATDASICGGAFCLLKPASRLSIVPTVLTTLEQHGLTHPPLPHVLLQSPQSCGEAPQHVEVAANETVLKAKWSQSVSADESVPNS